MIQLVEMEGKVNDMGCIEIPVVVFNQTGIHTGDTVKLVYMTGSDEVICSSREFVLLRGDENAEEPSVEEEAVKIQIPEVLLADAGIPLEADLDIVCREQKIIILPAEPVAEVPIPKELLQLCEEMGIRQDKVNVILRCMEEEHEEIGI